MNKNKSFFLFATLIIVILACNVPNAVPSETTPVSIETGVPAEVAPIATSTVSVVHISTPSTSPALGLYIYDVESSATALEKRAPYGDSYDINRLERPFL